jgi:hypothetical protein
MSPEIRRLATEMLREPIVSSERHNALLAAMDCHCLDGRAIPNAPLVPEAILHLLSHVCHIIAQAHHQDLAR